MRLLLFFVSSLFAFIFYWFHTLQNGRNFFWIRNIWKINFETFSWNLLIETFIFLFIWVLLFIYFSPNLKLEKISEKIEKNLKISYIIFYSILFLAILSWEIYYDIFVLFSIIFFIFSDLCFNFLSNIPYFKEQKENLRYFWLFLNYSSIFIALYYIFNFWFSVILLLILLFNIFFNYFIYKKYWNIASRFSYLVIIIFVLLFLFFRVLSVIWLNFNF